MTNEAGKIENGIGSIHHGASKTASLTPSHSRSQNLKPTPLDKLKNGPRPKIQNVENLGIQITNFKHQVRGSNTLYN